MKHQLVVWSRLFQHGFARGSHGYDAEPANLTVTVKPPHTAVWDINTFPGMTVMKSFFFLFYATQFIFFKKSTIEKWFFRDIPLVNSRSVAIQIAF